jgi:glycosyltransferase involved in cell wall biosynthesis
VLLNPANTAPVQGGRIVIVHDVLPLQSGVVYRKYAWWQRHVVRRALRNAAHICTSTAWSADQIARACAVSPTRISLIPQGLTPFVAPATTGEVQGIRARLDLQQPYFLAVGWGDRRKNLQFLLPAIEKLRAQRDVRLVIVGPHNGRVHRAPDVALPPWVHHLARPDDERCALYTGAVALCFPSLAEGYGRPPLEALACATPALVSDYGAAHEVFGAALELLPLEQEAWTRELGTLLESEEERQRRVARAETLLAGLSWAAAAEAVLEVANRVTARPGAVAV